jgi:predicted RNA-binding protein with PUA-like domain
VNFGFRKGKIFILAEPTTIPIAIGTNLQYKLNMAYWLVKSEPSAYSWEQLEKDKQTEWTGIRNYAARLHLRAMKKGDEVFFYHSNEGLEIVGIARVSKEAYQDPTTKDTAWVCVDLKPYKKLKKPVSLDTIKKDKRLKNMALVRIGRLSVQPVTEKEHDVILELAEEKK